MARFIDLPVELLVQIMCDCDDIKSVVKLSSVCKPAHQVWSGNAIQVAYAVFMFTKSELEDFLALSKIENWIDFI